MQTLPLRASPHGNRCNSHAGIELKFMSCTLNNSCEQGDSAVRFHAQHAVFVESSQTVAGVSAKIERARLLTRYIEDCRARQLA